MDNKGKPKSKLLRTVLLTLLTIGCAAIYMNYLMQQQEALEFKEPALDNTYKFEKGKHIYSLTALPSRLTYYLLPPLNFDPAKRYPLLVILHGGTGKAYAANFMAEDTYRKRYPGYILVPVAPPGHGWGSPYQDPSIPIKDAMPFVISLIKELSQTLPIDKGRIYSVGCSMGGGGSIVASLYYQDTFAAAAAMGGYFVPQYLPEKLATPLALLHGTKDKDVPIRAARKTNHIIKKAGGPIFFKELPEAGHDCPMAFFYPDTMWTWLYNQEKPELRDISTTQISHSEVQATDTPVAKPQIEPEMSPKVEEPPALKLYFYPETPKFYANGSVQVGGANVYGYSEFAVFMKNVSKQPVQILSVILTSVGTGPSSGLGDIKDYFDYSDSRRIIEPGDGVDFEKIWGFTSNHGHTELSYIFNMCWRDVNKKEKSCHKQRLHLEPSLKK